MDSRSHLPTLGSTRGTSRSEVHIMFLHSQLESTSPPSFFSTHSTYTHTHTHTQAQAHTHTHTRIRTHKNHTNTHTDQHTCTNTHTHTGKQTNAHAVTHTQTHTQMAAHMQARMRSHTHNRTLLFHSFILQSTLRLSQRRRKYNSIHVTTTQSTKLLLIAFKYYGICSGFGTGKKTKYVSLAV